MVEGELKGRAYWMILSLIQILQTSFLQLLLHAQLFSTMENIFYGKKYASLKIYAFFQLKVFYFAPGLSYMDSNFGKLEYHVSYFLHRCTLVCNPPTRKQYFIHIKNLARMKCFCMVTNTCKRLLYLQLFYYFQQKWPCFLLYCPK